MKLKILGFNPHLQNLTDFEIMTTDITILNGIVKGEPVYQKGVKISSSYYLDKAQTDLAIKKIFTDEYDENGFLIGLNMTIEWYDTLDNIGLSKDVYIPLSVSESASIISKRRKRAINYLQEAGVRLGVSQYIDLLFTHYSAYLVDGVTYNFINNFIENGTKEFENAVLNETNEQILGILNFTIEPPSAEYPNGVKVKDSILQQIT